MTDDLLGEDPMELLEDVQADFEQALADMDEDRDEAVAQRNRRTGFLSWATLFLEGDA